MLPAVHGTGLLVCIEHGVQPVGDEVASHHTCYFRMLTTEYQGFNLYQLEGSGDIMHSAQTMSF